MAADEIESTVRTFHWLDYTIFTLSLLVSLFVGMFSGAKDWADLKFERKGALRSKSGLKEQLLGGKELKALPVAFSLLASFLSAPFILGTPAEVYMYGTMYMAVIFAYIIATPVTAHLFVPVFHSQNLTSAYEFIERRFGGLLRLVGSFLFSFMMLLYMAVVVYAPAVAFSQVTGLPTLAAIMGVGVICTVYTAFGGMKAVIWTDVLQMIIIIVGVIALIIEGTIDVGGPAKVWDKVVDGGRIQLDGWSPDPTQRHTWWSQIIGGFFITLTLTATNQAMIQRYLSIKTTREAQLSCYYAGGLQVLLALLILLLSFVMYAFYADCDPVITGRIDTKDQLVPVFVMDSLGSVIGLPGLFSSSVFAASLSTISSGVNALAAVTMADVVLPLYKRNKMKKMPDLKAARLSKALAVIYGGLVVGLSFLTPFLGSTLIQVALSVFGMVGGPLLGLFILAIFFPCVNSWGALAGTLGSLIITCWIAIGAIVHPVIPTPLPLTATGCPFFFNGTNSNANITSTPDTGFVLSDLYSLSYMWYAVLSVITSLLIGLPVSFLTGGNPDVAKKDTSLFYPYHIKCRPCFNACGCDECLPIEDEEEIGEAHAYAVERGRARSSVDSVLGFYHEDPSMKRTSIAIQYGPTGSIMGGTIAKLPIHMIAHHDLGGIVEEEEDDVPAGGGGADLHGVSNPGYNAEYEAIHPAITLAPEARYRRDSRDIKAKGRLGLDAMRRDSKDIRRPSRDIGKGIMNLKTLSVDPKALEELHRKVDGDDGDGTAM